MAKKRVLILDDEASPRAVIREVLQRSGYEPDEAGDDPEGLAKAEAVRPDIILLEGRMRRLDGYEVCRRLKVNTRTQHIPVIFVTGVEDGELYALADEGGPWRLSRSPFISRRLWPSSRRPSRTRSPSDPRGKRRGGGELTLPGAPAHGGGADHGPNTKPTTISASHCPRAPRPLRIGTPAGAAPRTQRRRSPHRASWAPA